MKPNDSKKKILIYGIGNPGRGDDGLGWEVISRILDQKHPDIDFYYQYQLQVEDALLLRSYESVIFVDASKVASPPFTLEPVFPKAHLPIYTHFLSMENLLGLCQELYGYFPRTHVLGSRGYEW